MNRHLAATLVLLTAGCNYLPQVTPYRMEIQQGNFVTQDMLAQLKPGMTKEQVRFVLGTPLLVDPFHAERWEYVFSRTRENSQQLEQRRITVYFDEGGALARVAGDVVATPAAQPAPPGGTK